jgi:ABC-type branched-subunit amino acid transport system substrate-binding protein
MRAESGNGVVWISESTGSPHTASIAQLLVDDNLGAIPLSWYSAWPDPAFGQNVFEFQTNYCLESMNGIDWISREGGTKLAILSFPGEYGQDGAAGAKAAAEALGLEVVYDGEGKVVPGADQTPVIAELVDSGADWVWATINPTTLAEIMGGATSEGFEAKWSGNAPTYSFKLLATELAPLLGANYYYSTYTVTWGEDVPGMAELVSQFQEKRPDAPISDVYIRGWTEAMATHQILERAAELGDMTRAGVVAAANDVEVDFDGLAPNQSWGGDDPNDGLVRESYIYDVDETKYNIVPVTTEGGSTGTVLAEGPFTSDLAAEYDYQGACFAPQS